MHAMASSSYVPTSEDGVAFYWRPGCPFCMMLERSLNKAGIPLVKRNIWDDPDAAAFVRSVADGNEVVPTVAVGSKFMVNPSAKEVAAAIKAESPELLASAAEASADDDGSGEAGDKPLGRLKRRILGSS